MHTNSPPGWVPDMIRIEGIEDWIEKWEIIPQKRKPFQNTSSPPSPIVSAPLTNPE